MNWRPDDWKEIKANESPRKFVTCDSSYEAGADAILRALRKTGVKTIIKGQPGTGSVQMSGRSADILFPPDSAGYMVFIPDEESK
ncbi:MAG: hypothetical protein PHG35_03495 [Dehalococcoidales bacterium]|nr:hypothetical protein [Dehalococcoidales bacterium]